MTGLHLDAMASGTWQRPVTFDLQPGEVVVLLGRNGAGKTTLLNTIAGLVPVRSGAIVWNGRDISTLDAAGRVRAGIRIALEGRQLFGRLSVRDNLLLGAYGVRGRHELASDVEWVLTAFRELRPLMDRIAGTLSGGQQTMVSIGRALMGRPSLLLLDEPTLGLSPVVIERLLIALKDSVFVGGTSAIVAEQSRAFAEFFPQRLIIVQSGEIAFDGPLDLADARGVSNEVFI